MLHIRLSSWADLTVFLAQGLLSELVHVCDGDWLVRLPGGFVAIRGAGLLVGGWLFELRLRSGGCHKVWLQLMVVVMVHWWWVCFCWGESIGLIFIASGYW